MKKENEIHPSAGRKVIKKSGLQQVTDQIKSLISEKSHNWHVVLDCSDRSLLTGNSLMLHAHTQGKWVECPCCGKRTKTVHRYSYRKLQCTELLGHNVVLSLRTRHMKICMDFRKMLHGEENACTIDEWLKEAEACPLKEIGCFARYIRKDRNAVEQACLTSFSNALLEGTVNKVKAIKRSMFNRAGPDVLRAKLLYSTQFREGAYHLN